MCDALSPVWLSDAAVGGAVMLGLAMLQARQLEGAAGAAVAAGGVVAGFHALMWPNCLQRLEGVSPEATRLWLDHVREAGRSIAMAGEVAAVASPCRSPALVGWGC